MRPGRILVLDHAGARSLAARLADGRLEDLLIDPVDPDQPAPGAIYQARITRPLKGLGGAIVELGRGQQGFLKARSGLSPNALLPVQVNTTPTPGKPPGVTTRIALKRRSVIVFPGRPGIGFSRTFGADDILRAGLRGMVESIPGLDPESTGIVFRGACEHMNLSDIRDELDEAGGDACQILVAADPEKPGLRLAAPTAAQRARVDWMHPEPDDVLDETGSFDTLGIWDMIGAIRTPIARLPGTSGGTASPSGGPTLILERTHALVSVDVNAGGRFSPDAGYRTNLDAARELPRQLRLRGYGGQVVVDFAPMPRRNRQSVESVLARAFREDPVETALAGWTPLGHFELQRKNERFPLEDLAIDRLLSESASGSPGRHRS